MSIDIIKQLQVGDKVKIFASYRIKQPVNDLLGKKNIQSVSNRDLVYVRPI